MIVPPGSRCPDRWICRWARSHLGDLAVLDLGDPRLRDAHQGSNLRLGKPGVLPQLRELIAAPPGAHLRPAPLPLCDPVGTIPAGFKLPDLPLGVFPADCLHHCSFSISHRTSSV